MLKSILNWYFRSVSLFRNGSGMSDALEKVSMEGGYKEKESKMVCRQLINFYEWIFSMGHFTNSIIFSHVYRIRSKKNQMNGYVKLWKLESKSNEGGIRNKISFLRSSLMLLFLLSECPKHATPCCTSTCMPHKIE